MTLDVVVPTYRRSSLLRAALLSLLRAPVPAGLGVTIYVVDNASGDDTASVVHEIARDASLPIRYVCETQQGISRARNAGIAAGNGELIGFIDDDEEIGSDWFQVIAREFADDSLSYIGGPYLPKWISPVPDWLPPGYPAVIGAIPPKPRAPFGDGFPGNLMGGNAVLRRTVFERVGLYAPHLGRSGKGLLSEEDAEFFGRLLASGLRGMYVPELAIEHLIAPNRLTRAYHRRWVYWRAVSQGVHHRSFREPVTYLLGVPRHRIGSALRGWFVLLRSAFRRQQSKGVRFAHELATWDLLGFLYGRFFVRVETLYSSRK